MKTRDLKVVREYSHKGIDIRVELNLVSGTASFVEFNMGKGWVPKKWLFAERSLEYVKTWGIIFEAMQKVNKEIISILEAYEKDQLTNTVRALGEMAKDSKGNAKLKKKV